MDGKQRPAGAEAVRAYAADQASKDPTLTSLLSHLGIRRAQVLAGALSERESEIQRLAAELAQMEAHSRGSHDDAATKESLLRELYP